jgi:hypothetical protein
MSKITTARTTWSTRALTISLRMSVRSRGVRRPPSRSISAPIFSLAGLIRKSPVTNVAAKPIRPRTIQSWSKLQASLSITSAIPIRTTTRADGMNSFSASRS